MTLPAALAPLGENRRNQFITWKLVPGAEGKMTKIPTDWRNGEAADAHNPGIWTDYDTAWVTGEGRVGFVLTADDPFWCLDIDNCLVAGKWSPLAMEMMGRFAGAAVEVSQSGKGLHIWGTGLAPRHSTKAPGLELYHENRFIALGGHPGATGNCLLDCTAQLASLVADCFTPRERITLEGWTHAPVAEWSGPIDDDDLIKRATSTRSAAGVFGSKATFAALWDADAAILGRAFPDATRAYDASSADAALIQHLAFWTGKNCERMLILIKRSRLRREKWARADYLHRTILQACAQQADVCKLKPIEVATVAPEVLGVRDVVGETYLQPDQQRIMFAGCTYITESNTILMPGGHMLNEGRFNATLGGFQFVLDHANSKLARNPWDAFLNSRVIKHPRAHGVEFDPTKAPGELWKVGGNVYANSYHPRATESKRGNPLPFIQHIHKLLPSEVDRQIILAYMAAVVQFPGVKFQWAPLLQGVEGNGKTLLSRCVIEAVGREYCHAPKSAELASKFNDWLEGRIFISVEDIYVPHEQDAILESLKPMITNDWQEVEGKGATKRTRNICANFMLNCNRKDAVKKTINDRRFAVFHTAQQMSEHLARDGMDGSYFPNLYAWLKRDGYAIVTDYLKNYPIPPHLNPATLCHRAPRTTSYSEAVISGTGYLGQEIANAVEMERIGFRGGWVSAHFLDILIRECKEEKRFPRNRRKDLLLELGYQPHPMGQCGTPVAPDGVRTTLYLMVTHEAWDMPPADAQRAYTMAQSVFAPAPS